MQIAFFAAANLSYYVATMSLNFQKIRLSRIFCLFLLQVWDKTINTSCRHCLCRFSRMRRTQSWSSRWNWHQDLLPRRPRHNPCTGGECRVRESEKSTNQGIEFTSERHSFDSNKSNSETGHDNHPYHCCSRWLLRGNEVTHIPKRQLLNLSSIQATHSKGNHTSVRCTLIQWGQTWNCRLPWWMNKYIVELDSRYQHA